MNQEQLIELITREVQKALKEHALQGGTAADAISAANREFANAFDEEAQLLDLVTNQYKDAIEFVDPENELALQAIRRATTARVGIGRSGSRLTTKAMLALRADHAMAKDAVLKSVDEELLKQLNLPILVSKCEDINEHLTRPDLGRRLSDQARDFITNQCEKNPQIQVYVSDGLSNSAVESNIPDLLPVLMDGLLEKQYRVGTPFFLKYGRVPALDEISELTGAEVTCVLLGERPGLAAADSLSAYISYGAYMGIPESKRTVVSNIHQNGIQPVEAGAYLAEVLGKILEEKKSGVDLNL